MNLILYLSSAVRLLNLSENSIISDGKAIPGINQKTRHQKAVKSQAFLGKQVL